MGGGKLEQLCPGERQTDPHAHGLRRRSGESEGGASFKPGLGEETTDPGLVFNPRLGITAGCAGKTATARNSGSSTSPQRSTRTASSTPRTIRTAGSIDSPQEPSEFARGESRTLEHVARSLARSLANQPGSSALSPQVPQRLVHGGRVV